MFGKSAEDKAAECGNHTVTEKDCGGLKMYQTLMDYLSEIESDILSKCLMRNILK